jgi:hypothetical protein
MMHFLWALVTLFTFNNFKDTNVPQSAVLGTSRITNQGQVTTIPKESRQRGE